MIIRENNIFYCASDRDGKQTITQEQAISLLTDQLRKMVKLNSPDCSPRERKITGGWMPIERENVLVAVGGGVRCREDMVLLKELAAQLGGGLCGSRVTVDRGWIDASCEVGLSGKRVSPKIYIAVGIAGVYYHRVGMKQSEYVIAVNTDPTEPIFEEADLGFVCDYRMLLPLLLKKLSCQS